MDNRIGAQLYNLREYCQDKAGLDESLAKVSKIGYKTIQVSGIGPIPAADVKETADKYGLEIMLTHKSGKLFEEDLKNLVNDQKTMNCPIAGLGAMDQEYRSMEGVKRFCEKYSAIADELSKEGLVFAYHNHTFEFYKENGMYLMDYIIENTDPAKFKFIVDTYWVAFAGIDPVKFLKKLGDRAIVVHYKDLKAKLDNSTSMCEIGQGNLDWDEIIKVSHEIGSKCAMVELDYCDNDPFDALKTSYDYLKTKGFC